MKRIIDLSDSEDALLVAFANRHRMTPENVAAEIVAAVVEMDVEDDQDLAVEPSAADAAERAH